MKKLDWYIIRKFLGTFFFALSLIISISVIFDISEKIDDFLEKDAPISAIVFDYYFNFIPYFANLFSPLFVFIAVIYFTSRMANNTEIVAILAGGISFRRLLRPYFIAATVIAAISLYANGWLIPHSNVDRLNFENTYIRNQFVLKSRNIHRQIRPGEFIYFESYNTIDNIGYQFSIEKIENGALTSKLMADRLRWDSTSSKWTAENYFIREIDGMNEKITSGERLDTTLNVMPEEFSRRLNLTEAMDNGELSAFIEEEKMRGSDNLDFYLVEKYRRYSLPFATFILTLIGVSLASRKVRGGIGGTLGLGIGLSFVYIMFMQISNTFATNGNVPAIVAVWIPNMVFGVIGLYLLRTAPK